MIGLGAKKQLKSETANIISLAESPKYLICTNPIVRKTN
jgi:hypothetical protein